MTDRKSWIVEIFGGNQWRAPWQGDPGRTCVIENAKRFKSEHAAQCALSRAKSYYPNRDLKSARVVSIEPRDA